MRYPKEVILVRHGESEANILSSEARTKLDSSTKDYGLTPLGYSQAKNAGEYLKNTFGSFDAFYTSYCKRTKETMLTMFPSVNIIEDARVAEAQRGIWHAMSEEDIDVFFPHERARRDKEGLYYYRPFGGENWPDLELRIHNFIESLFREHCGQRIVICVHGHWHIAFQRIMHGFSTDETIEKYKHDVAPNGSITIYKGALVHGRPKLLLSKSTFIPEPNLQQKTSTLLSKFQFQHR